MADRALLEQVAPSPTFITYTYPVHDQAPSVQLALGDCACSLAAQPMVACATVVAPCERQPLKAM